MKSNLFLWGGVILCLCASIYQFVFDKQKIGYIESSRIYQEYNSYHDRDLLAQLPRGQYGSYVQLFSSGIDSKIKVLTASGKSHNASMVSYQPTYNMGRSDELLAVFDDNIPITEDVELHIEEFGMNLGILKFKFTSDQLNYNPYIDHV